MKIIFFDTHAFERPILETVNKTYGFSLQFAEARLTSETAGFTKGFDVVCSFANDKVDEKAISILAASGIKLIALRSAGFNHVDLAAASKHRIPVVRVPEYSPYSVAEHAVALMLSLNRKIHRAHQRVRELNFSLNGLVGFDLHGKTVGIVGTGRIGSAVAKILHGFGCKILAHDLTSSNELVSQCDVTYVSLAELLQNSRIISLHVPLTPKTWHLIGEEQIEIMQKDVMLVNTGRGKLIDTKAIIRGLKSGKLGAVGLDVYEEEENVFFHDLSDSILQDDVLARLMTFPNVLITAHQGFLTEEALNNIAKTTFENVDAFRQGKHLINQVTV